MYYCEDNETFTNISDNYYLKYLQFQLASNKIENVEINLETGTCLSNDTDQIVCNFYYFILIN